MDEEISKEELNKIRKEAQEEIFEGKMPTPVKETVEQSDDHAQDDHAHQDTPTDSPSPETTDSSKTTEEVSTEEIASDNDLSKKLDDIGTKLNSLETIEQRLKQSESRIGAIQNKFNEFKNTPAPTAEELTAAEELRKSIEEFKEEFPEFNKAIDAKFTEFEKKYQAPNVDEIRQGLQSMQGSVVTQDVLEKRLLGMVHPDWEDIRKSDNYKIWIVDQSDDIKKKHLYGETANDAIFVLNEFKKFQDAKAKQQQTQNQKENRLQAAVVPNTNKKPVMVKSEADMTEQELRAKLAAEIWND